MRPEKLLRRFHGSLVILGSMPGQKRSQFMPRNKLNALRDSRLRQIVRYAGDTVPHYRDTFRKLGLSAADFSTVDDLKKLPAIDKSTVAKSPVRFVSESRAGRNSVLFHTSGTTGERLSVWLDRRYLLAQAAIGLRERAVVGSLLGKQIAYKTLYINYPECTPAKIWGFYEETAFSPIGANRHLVSISKPFEEIVDIMNSYQPDVLASYGSYHDLLFRFLAEEDVKVWLPKIVRYGADHLSPAGRHLIEHHFGIPVLSNYGTVECLKIGFQCQHNTGFHLHEDICHVDILREDGERGGPGEKGEVAISGLINRGSVLLNYRIGDLATVSSQPCPCGRTTKRLVQLEGRIEDVIFLENGQTVHPRTIWSVFKSEPGVAQYQLTQLSPSHFELRLVTNGRETFDDVKTRVVGALRAMLGDQVRIETFHCQELSREESGKFRPVRSLCRE